MSLVPVVMDLRPPYTGHDLDSGSMLLLPLADDLLLREMMRSVSRVTAHPPIILTAFTPDEAYTKRIRSRGDAIDRILGIGDLREVIERSRPSEDRKSVV